jgi:hypothetical protein
MLILSGQTPPNAGCVFNGVTKGYNAEPATPARRIATTNVETRKVSTSFSVLPKCIHRAY